ncbi:nucleotide exchange factor GrpE [Candidatus Comchoanobacter bicostacola]|uniref:Protein GrpE n=1 Tax=Candidatus Comchoanobacter bicostacola TaxID=2919598 RepID=A0ABY5DMB5_9GAMM|nr:nucleotide exchange factor GrpE [Candidatus Comchoanobacter bicostacola]UTC24694.1 nucleotide exchange factor GrpE [Candidatus Comchoanobacter bicostacola]
MTEHKSESLSAEALKPAHTDSLEQALEEANATIQTLQTENEVLTTKIEETKDQFIRQVATHRNQITQIEKNSTNKAEFAISKFAKEIIAIGDVLQTGLNNCSDQESDHYRGMSMTLDKFYHTLEEHDITRIQSLGEAFNPEFHEALTTQESDEIKPNHVLHVVQEGYMLKNRVLRHTKVIVSKKISSNS